MPALAACRPRHRELPRASRTVTPRRQQEPGGRLEAVLSWQAHPDALGYEVVRCDAAAQYPCDRLPHGTTGTTSFSDTDIPSELYWYQVLALVDDRYEENDVRPEGAVLPDGMHADLIRCPADDDWFRVEPACVGAELRLQLDFSAAEGDLDLRLHDAMGTLLAESATAGDSEMLVHDIAAAEPHYLQVDMVADAGVQVGSPYVLAVSGLAGSTDCAPDRFEPNPDAPSARDIPVQRHDGLTACDEGDGLNNDFYAVEATAGQTLEVTVEFTHADGDIDLNLYGVFQQRVRQSQSSDDDELISYVVEDTGRHLIQVFLFQLAPCSGGNDYDLVIELL